MDEREIYEVTSRPESAVKSPKVAIPDIFVDKNLLGPYNPRQIDKSDELNI
jgi:hypothetical protein